jgi:hypothetical protein
VVFNSALFNIAKLKRRHEIIQTLPPVEAALPAKCVGSICDMADLYLDAAAYFHAFGG